jgi:hypothetical protein
VYFVENGVFFRCEQETYAEQLLGEASSQDTEIFPVRGLSDPLSTANRELPLRAFEIMLTYYTKRALTNQSDILRALAGIVRRTSERATCQFLEGIPIPSLDRFITFQADGCIFRRRGGFPSYSWTGWKGRIIFDTPLPQRWNGEKAACTIWYKRSPSGVVSLVQDSSELGPRPVNDARQFSAHFRTLLGSSSIQVFPTIPTEPLPVQLPATEYHLLQFWALSVHFKLQTKDALEGTAFILDEEGARLGCIKLDGIEESAFFDSPDSFEFIVFLSLPPHWEDEVWRYFIMLLEWKGPIAERRGISLVDGSAFARSRPQWKEIVLG